MRCAKLILIWAGVILTILLMWSLTSPALTFGRHQHDDNSIPSRDPEVECSIGEYTDSHVEETQSKLILFYKFPDYYELQPASGFEIFSSCSRKCELTVNISRFAEANLVVFFSHAHIVPGADSAPPKKLRGQIWVFFSVEPPPFSGNSGFGASAWHRLFNWTMTYRLDSEYWHGYLRAVRRVKPVEQEKRIKDEKEWKEVFSKKTKLIAWFVSHCGTDSKREIYVSQLSRYINVDVYGKCGTLQCEDRKKCLEMVRNDYKFYLSFENALCKDYVTEKLIEVFDIGAIVPVVRGGADYHKLFPNNSVIDTRDFPSPESLAQHLKALAADEEAYIKMLKWSWEYEIQGPKLPLCQLCHRLYEPEPASCVYKNVYAWWSQGICHRPKDL